MYDSTGSLELKEVMMLFHDFYGNDFMENKAVKGMLDLLGKAMKRKDEDSTIADLRLNVNEFKDFCHSHRMLLGPAYVFQLRMRKQICGKQICGTPQISQTLHFRRRFLEEVQ